MRRSFYLLALALPLAVGCKKRVPASYKYSVYVESAGAVVELDGKTLSPTSSTPQGASFDITLPASEHQIGP